MSRVESAAELPRPAVPRPERVLFTVGAIAYRRRDLVAAAGTWGEWDALVHEAREELACAARAAAAGDPLDPSTVLEAGSSFRRAQGLLAAEELEAWLAERGVGVADWLAHVRRSLLRELWRDELDVPSPEQDAADLLVVAWTIGICSGVLGDLGDRLAAEAAAEAELSAGRQPEIEGDALDDADVGADALERRAALYDRLVEQAVTSAGIARELEAHRLDWTSVDCAIVVHPDLDVLREARLCVVDDGLELDAVARDAGAELRRSRLLVGELPTDVGTRLLGVEPGQLLEPLPVGDVAWLVRVDAKTRPSAADPALRDRAAELIAARARARAVDTWVRWHERL